MKNYGVIILLALAVQLFAEESPSVSEKSARYHKLLVKRPDSSTLFERFIDSWLDTGSKESLEQFLKDDASSGDASRWRLLGAYYEWVGQEEAALSAFDTALEKSPDNGMLLVARAKLKARLLNFEEALKDLQAAGDAAGKEAKSLEGTWLARAGRPEEAVKAWKKILAANPEDEALREDLIELEVGEGLYDEAMETLENLIKDTKDPYQKALRSIRLAGIQSTAGQGEASIATYRELIEKTGEDSWLEKEILAQVEMTFQREENLTGLREFYQQLREKFPQRVSLRKGLAQQMAVNGEDDEAIALFREILQITPGDRANREQFINTLEGMERYGLALQELEVLLRDRADDQALLEHKARLHNQTEAPKELQETLSRLADLRRGDSSALIATASLYERYRLAEDAEQLLREATRLFPDKEETKEALAAFLAKPENEDAKQDEATKIWLGLAEGANAEGLLRVARSLQSNRRMIESFELLESRIADFPNNALLLTQLCQCALGADRSQDAFPHALHLASLAEAPTELNAALRLVSSLGRRVELNDAIRTLSGKSEKSLGEWCALSELQELLGDHIASEEALAEARKIDDGVLVVNQQVRLLESRGEYQRAVEQMRSLITLPGGNRPVHLRRLIDLLVSAGELEEALDEVEGWKRVAPGDKSAWLRRADLLNQLGRVDEVVKELRRALSKFGDESDLRSQLARALIDSGDYLGGERIYFKLYEESEDAANRNRWITELASLAQQEGRIEELLANFERRKRNSPRENAPLRALARIHEVLNNHDEQHAVLAEALRRRPKDLNLRAEISILEEQSGAYEQAANTLREGLALVPGPAARRKLADFYFRNGEFDLGLDLLFTLDAGDPRSVEQTVLSLCQSGEWEMALTYLGDSGLTDLRLKCLQALALIQLDRVDEAVPLINQLLVAMDVMVGVKPAISEQIFEQWKSYYGRTNQGWSAPQVRVNYFTNHLSQAENQWGRAQGRYGYRGSQQLSFLPGIIEEVNAFAFALVLHEGRLMTDEEVRADFYARFSIPNDRFHQSLVQSDFAAWVVSEFRAGRLPFHEAISHMGEEDITREELENAVRDPELISAHPMAVDTAVQLLYSSESKETRQWFQYRLDLFSQLEAEERDEALTRLAGQVLIQSGQRRSYIGGTQVKDDSFGSEEREALRQFLWKEIDSRAPKAKPLIEQGWFISFVKEAFLTGDAESYVRLINRWSAAQKAIYADKKNPNADKIYYQGRFYSRSQFGRSQSNPLVLPPFPTQLDSVPHVIFEHFQAGANTHYFNNQAPSERQQEFLKKWKKALSRERKDKSQVDLAVGIDPLDLKPLIARIDQPEVRVFAWHWVGAEDELAEEMKQLASSDSPQSVLLAAGYQAQIAGDLLEAFKMVNRVRLLSLDKNQRTLVDGYLAFLGSQLVDKLPVADLTAAQRAFLRVRRSSAVRGNDNQLAQVMKKLQLELTTPVPRHASRRYSPRSSFSQRSRNNRNEMGTLIANGDFEPAARQVFKALTKAYRSSGRFDDYQTREEMELVKTNESLKDALLEVAHPGESRSFQRRMQYAALCEILELPEKALNFYQKLAKERPHDDQLRGKILSIQAQENVDDVLKQITKETSLDEVSSIVRALLGEGSRNRANEATGKNLPTVLRVSIQSLEQLEPEVMPTRDLTWVLSIYQLAVGEGYFSDSESRLPSMGQLHEDVHEERRELVRKLISASLPHPQITTQAFQIAEGCRETLGYRHDELVEMSFTSLAASEQWDLSSHQWAHFLKEYPWAIKVRGSYHGSSPPVEAGLLPVIFVSRYILGLEKPLESREFIRLREIAPDKLSDLEWAVKLGSANVAIAQENLEEWQQQLSSEPKERLLELGTMARMLLAADNESPVLATVEEGYLSLLVADLKKINYSYQQTHQRHFGEYLFAKWDPEEPEKLREALEKFTHLILGERALWEEFAALKKENSLPNELSQMGYGFRTIAQSLTQQINDLGVISVLAGVSPIACTLSSGDFQKVIKAQYPYASEEEGWKQFQSLDWESLDWGTLADKFGDSLFLDVFASHFNSNQKMRKMVAEKSLEDQSASRLKKLVLAYYINNDSALKKAVLKQITSDVDALNKLPRSQQMALGALLQKPFPLGAAPQASEEAKQFLSLINEERVREEHEKIERYIRDGIPASNITSYDMRREIGGLIRMVMESDTQLAARLFLRFLQDVGEASALRSNSRKSPEQAIYEVYEGVIDNLGDRGGTYASFVPVFCMVESDPITEAFEPMVNNYDIYQLTQSTYNTLKPRKNLEGVESKLFAKWHWDDFAEKITYEDPSTHKIAQWLFWVSHVGRWNPKEAKDFWKWTESSGFEKKYPEVCRMRRLLLAASAWKNLSEGQQEAAVEIWEKVLTEDDIPMRLRMGMVCAAASGGRNFFAHPKVLLASSRLCQLWGQEKRDYLNDPVRGLLEALAHPRVKLVAAEWQPFVRRAHDDITSPGNAARLDASRNSKQKYLVSLANLAMKCGEDEMLTALLRRSRESFRGQPDFLLALADHEDRELINNLLAADGNVYATTSIKWNADIATTVGKLLSRIDDPKDRYRLECLFASAQDDSEAVTKSEDGRGKRLDRLAEKYEELAPKAAVAQMECLGYLTARTTREIPAALFPPLEKIGQRWNLAQTLGDIDPIPKETLKTLLRKYTYLRLSKGDWESLDKQVDTLIPLMESGRNYSTATRDFYRFFTAINHGFLVQSLESEELVATPEVLDRSLRYLKVALTARYSYRYLQQCALGFATIAHAEAGQGKALNVWLGALDGKALKSYKEIKQYEVVRRFNDDNWTVDVNEPLRREFFHLLTHERVTSKRVFSHFSGFYSLIGGARLSRKELTDWVMALPPEYPRKAEIVLELARAAALRGKKYEEAKPLFEDALGQAQAAEELQLVNSILAWHAWCLKHIAKDEERALEMINSVDFSRLGKDQRKDFSKKFPHLKLPEEETKSKPIEKVSP